MTLELCGKFNKSRRFPARNRADKMMDEDEARCKDAEPKLASRRTTVCDAGPTYVLSGKI